MGWGQFIRWADPRVERRHYHLHKGAWPSPARQPGCSGPPRRPRWPTWTATAATRSSGSPTSRSTSPTARRATRSWCWTGRTATGTARLDGTAASRRCRCPTTRSTDPTATGTRRAGSRADRGRHRRRRPARDRLRPSRRQGLRRRAGRPRLWSYQYAPRRAKTFASEVVAADLNKDGTPELVFGTYALHRNAGRLIVLSAAREEALGHPVAPPAAERQRRRRARRASIATSPATAPSRSCSPPSTTASTSTRSRAPALAACPWPTGRGNLLRNGIGPATAP